MRVKASACLGYYAVMLPFCIFCSISSICFAWRTFLYSVALLIHHQPSGFYFVCVVIREVRQMGRLYFLRDVSTLSTPFSHVNCFVLFRVSSWAFRHSMPTMEVLFVAAYSYPWSYFGFYLSLSPSTFRWLLACLVSICTSMSQSNFLFNLH